MVIKEEENPLMNFMVGALVFICLVCLATQTWYYIDWLMGPSEWYMKYFTLCFFDISGGVWLILRLFHTAPNKAMWQMKMVAIVFCAILSLLTTAAWCYVFITRTPLSQQEIASMVDAARWLVVVAVVGNAFMFIVYGTETMNHKQQKKNPNRKRWESENIRTPQQTFIPLPQPTIVTEQPSMDKPVEIGPASTDNDIPPVEASTNKKKRKLPA